MNVLVVGRLVSGGSGGRDAGQRTRGRIEAHGDSISAGHEQCRFNRLFDAATPIDTVYHKVCRPIVKSFTRGFNTALILLDQGSDAHVTASLTGSGDGPGADASGGRGLMQHFIQDIFAYLSDEQAFLMTVSSFEVYAEQVRDMLAPEAKGLRVVETPDAGWTIRDISTNQVRGAGACMAAFKTAFAERTSDSAKRHRSCFCFHINLSQGDMRAVCRIVVLPVVDAVVADPTRARLTHGAHVVQGPVACARLIEAHASQDMRHQLPDIVDSSIMTRLIADTMGNNCQTAAIAHIQETMTAQLPEYLRLCVHLRQIKNYPVQNQSNLRGLVESFRATMLSLKNSTSGLLRDMGLSGGEEHDAETKLVESNLEILKLKDLNSKFNNRLQTAQATIAREEAERKDLTAQLLDSEEERLLLTKAMLEMQLEHAQTTADAEKRAHEDKSRISSLEEDLDASVAREEQLQQTIADLQDNVTALEGELESRQREIASLKSGTLALDEDFSIRLRAKIATLVKSKMKLLQDRDALAEQIVTLEGHPHDPAAFKKATQTAVNNTEKQGEEIASMILQRTRIESKDGDVQAVSTTDTTNKPSSSSSSLQATLRPRNAAAKERRVEELRQELRSVQQELELLQKENKRMATAHDAFVRDHRKRLEKHVKEFSTWMTKNNAGGDGSDRMKQELDQTLQDQAATYQQEVNELRARMETTEKQLLQRSARLRRLVGVYRGLRDLCEENDLPVPSAHRFEEAQLDENAEIIRLRKALRGAHALSLATSGGGKGQADGKAADALTTFTSQIQRKLEDERSQLLVSMARAEQKIKVMEEFIRTRLKPKKKK
ncbi:hypothetical protein PTSG_00382 [Salpingoeca rosetta]|uniref:Kinesin motor domain-containing protein n=1 Tax=Salpingoeca rosetta (strain ATCC 50818 / BSB-021) TaxID=946362 RepID=F2TWB6_SALR5|nr:uncharacterized protein PTSG_00382 [Salpingoeca rosetta]EGD72362.1 hypothetical protein PTSG_00382 [Salpingoeca rosetta]|eukprot:XP_004998931.1 hypothetical protein PTSG_00382 [Salpingoeca rosetta]